MIYLTATDLKSATLELPIRPYTCKYKMAIDISKNEDGTYTSYDNGEILDTPSCECTFQLEKSAAMDLYTFLESHRQESFKLEIDTGSGFYPFMPHNGNIGPWLVDITADFKGFLDAPYKYHKIDVVFTMVYNDSSWFYPAIITEPDTPVITEGDMTIAGVYGVQFPKNGFQPVVNLNRSIQFDEMTNPYHYSKGLNADSAESSMDLQMNLWIAYELLNELITSTRASNFDIIVLNSQFPFGENYGDSKTFSCKLLQNTFELTFQEYNLIETTLKMVKI